MRMPAADEDMCRAQSAEWKEGTDALRAVTGSCTAEAGKHAMCGPFVCSYRVVPARCLPSWLTFASSKSKAILKVLPIQPVKNKVSSDKRHLPDMCASSRTPRPAGAASSPTRNEVDLLHELVPKAKF